MNSARGQPRQTGACAGKTPALHRGGRASSSAAETSSEPRRNLNSGSKSRDISSRSWRGPSAVSASPRGAISFSGPSSHAARGLTGMSGSSVNKARSERRVISKPPRVTPRDALSATKTCPLCCKPISPGQRFMEFSVTIPDSVSTRKGVSEKRQVKLTISRRVGSVPPPGRSHSAPAEGTVSAPFHVDCLTCAECGKPLVTAETGPAGQKDNRVIFDKNGAVEAFTSAVRERQERGNTLTKKGPATSRLGRVQPVFPIAAVRHFVFHEKCQERLCAVCHHAIKPGEPQLALPKSFPGDSASEAAGKQGREALLSNGTSQGDDLEAAMLAKKSEKDNQVYQHLGCTRCFSCGEGFVMGKGNDSEPYMLLDELRQPHHPTCLACCCCRQPLVAKYEIQSFFGKQEVCCTAISNLRSLSPLPGGASAGTLQAVSSPGSGVRGSVTAKYGGLCCAWCAARVPRCLCCERRCAVYQAPDGRRIAPKAITKAARPAADHATAIGLGKIKPPPVSHQHPPSSKETSPAGLYGEMRGVMCGQCAALPVVETESSLRRVAEWLLRLYADAGLVFSSDMLRLQQLMRNVSEDQKKRQQELEDRSRLGSHGAGKGTTAGIKARSTAVRTANNRTPAVRQSRSFPITTATSDTTFIARIDDLVVPIELVDFSELNPEFATSRHSKEALQKTAAPGGVKAKLLSITGRRAVSSVSSHGKTVSAGAPDKGLSLCGRCHVQEVTLMASPGAALQFDEQVRAQAQAEKSQLGGGGVTSASDGATAPIIAGGERPEQSGRDLHLRRQSTFVHRDVFDVASAYAASLEGNLATGASKDASKVQGHRQSEEGHPGRHLKHDVRPEVAAGALLMTGSFAGGLVRTLTGTHTQGLSVRLVERVCVVGHVPRVLVLQHLSHELLHAYLACKQKEITDHSVEEGACNVAAAEALLHRLAQLVAENPDVIDGIVPSTKREDCSQYEDGEREPRHNPFELLVLQYRLWKMRESKDPVYGEGYRTCLGVVEAKHFTFGEFVEWLLVS